MPEETASHPSVWVMVGERHLLRETDSIVAQGRVTGHSLSSDLERNESASGLIVQPAPARAGPGI